MITSTFSDVNLPAKHESEIAEKGLREFAAFLSTKLETTQEAANILNVSRPHMVKLLEDGCLPFHKTGRHRRIRFADLMEYKKQRNAESMEAMRELANQAQELGIY
ncbi:helix-turn-helix domain-containing protein [Photorhabdus kleinii]|uniref:helix-turn-helix domain-containing protein n=1 Tax=Photorhabdus kleinii TaxID=768034 RepID=UPI0021D51B25|nr:helix-turn-helix domain-containing protein [Photorhabdus kleinii]MCT8341707.1 helix-turn-helix domain-containing protein [Photorhabdus kleinii]